MSWEQRLRVFMDKMIWTNEWEKCHFDYERTAEGARSADKDGADDDGQDTGADNPLREWMPSDASDLGHPRSFENVGMADRLRMLLWLIHWQLDENKEFKEWIRAECKSKDTRDASHAARYFEKRVGWLHALRGPRRGRTRFQLRAKGIRRSMES